MRSEIPMTDKAHAIADGIKTVPAAGDTTTWLRDEATGLVTNKVYADGKGPCYDYTPDGKLATRTWARGIVTTYSYDDNGALTNTVYSDGTPTISLAYNRAGRQIKAVDAAGVTTFLYDDFGSLTNETVVGVAGTNTIERFYDTFGRNAGYSLNGVRQSTLAYDSATGRLASMQVPSEQSNNPNNQTIKQFSWNYFPGSDLKSSLAYPNGLTASWQYDANNQLLQVCNATPTNTISQYDYAYDTAGRRINVSKSGSAFDHDDTIAYGYNSRSELTNAVAAVDSDYRYAYDFDDIGNRESSSERGTNVTCTANILNQYTLVGRGDPTALEEEFVPQFDDDGNQTLVKTSTGIWSVAYNGENRPNQWSNGATNITMKFDRMGRRVEYLETVAADAGGSQSLATNTYHRFVYDGYLCIQRLNAAANNAIDLIFAWDPAEPVATRPLMIEKPGKCMLHVTHDGNKNVSDLVFFNGGSGVAAHYEYAPFGSLTDYTRNSTSTVYDFCTYNPFRFSSEYADDALGLVYYNYRHYDPVMGRWLSRDLLETDHSLLENQFCHNSSTTIFDCLGRDWFAPPGPPPGGWNAPPVVVSPSLPSPAQQSEQSQLEKDRDELESKLAAWCPLDETPISTKWKSICCKDSCRKQAHLLADKIYNAISAKSDGLWAGGWFGNLLSYADKGRGCVEWQDIVYDAYREYAAAIQGSEQCFRASRENVVYMLWGFVQHNWVGIELPGSDNKIDVDPWRSGGQQMFPF